MNLIKFLRWLFSPHNQPIMRDDRYEHEDDDWNYLAGLGYKVLKSSTRKNRYCFTDNGVSASSWFTVESFEELQRIRRRWAREEVERLQRIDAIQKKRNE